MSIMKSQYLKKEITNYNVIPLEVSAMKISNQLYLNIDEIEDFLKYANDSNSNYVYYQYSYYNFEEYIIPKDWYSEYSKEFRTEIRVHNQHIESLDFGSPKSLTLFILQNGTFVGVEIKNHWIENQGIHLAEDTIEFIENKFYCEVKEIIVNKKGQQKKDENQLREIIFIDPEFKLCKNQELRYWYLVELLEKENMKKYDYLVQPPGIPHRGKVKMFMDKTWELFKERKRQYD
ncbi:hypothetical protein GCM10011351_26900 [Paraliobacillus quinghaiensis]|uniref:Uncharacterized protein n=1 Tax=Paraliobacillus quinghaiensis TaxID=470815 RepID=A0A917TV70_9BACI|nr:hypothetical protein [Paraliobacillus quinghaiensis]GGM39353.1 hypothetical protein GCM10011351_26900 [Paraliobacillus quinghaiensis]